MYLCYFLFLFVCFLWFYLCLFVLLFDLFLFSNHKLYHVSLQLQITTNVANILFKLLYTIQTLYPFHKIIYNILVNNIKVEKFCHIKVFIHCAYYMQGSSMICKSRYLCTLKGLLMELCEFQIWSSSI